MSTPATDITAIPKDRHNTWAGLYGLTAVLQAPCAICRALVIYITVGLSMRALSLFAPWVWQFHRLTDLAAAVFGLGPLLWSAAALITPVGHGWWWQQQSGGRPPSKREALAVEEALDALLDTHPEVRRPARWFVLDDPTPNAFVLGDSLAINRGTIDSDGLEPVVAHELGHVNAIDGRISLAIWRFTVLPGRFSERPVSLGLIAHIRWLFMMLADGTLPMYLTRVLWGNYFRWREYAADHYAYMLGQGEELAAFLDNHALMHDSPIPWVWLTERTHPPTELRIDRLTNYDEAEPSAEREHHCVQHQSGAQRDNGGNEPNGPSQARTDAAGNSPNALGGLDRARPAR